MATRGARYEAMQRGDKSYKSTCGKHGDVLRSISGTCFVCRQKRERESYYKNPAKFINKTRMWYDKNQDRAIERARLDRLTKPEEVLEKEREQAKLRSREWRKQNPGHRNYLKAMYKASIKQRIPQWADKEKILEVYKNCPSGYHVDHIIPLRGKIVSGLHIPENLQYLPAVENMRKNNRFGESA